MWLCWSLLLIITQCSGLAPMPPLSTKDPVSMGYAAVTRNGNDRPLYDMLCFADKRKVFPTNHWWVPAVRPPSTIGRNYLVQLPYIYNLVGTGMEVYYPYVKGMGNIVQNMLNEFGPSWKVNTEDAKTYCVKDADELTVTVTWGTAMRSTITRGSPYVTAHYEGSPVQLSSPLGIQKFTVDGAEVRCGEKAAKGKIFTTVLNNDEEWTIFTPPDTELQCSSGGLSTVGPFSGVVRLALSNNCTSGKSAGPTSHCGPGGTSQVGEYAQALVTGSAACIDGAQVNTEWGMEGVINTITWQTSPCWGPQQPMGPLMMTALPHHLPILDKSSTIVSGGGHRNARGLSRGVLTTGHVWVLTMPHHKIEWLGSPQHSKASTILKMLKGRGNQSDMNYNLNQWAAQGMIDPYNAGKLIAKLATLVQIADHLGEKAIRQTLLSRVITHLSLWLDQHSKNRLVYDSNWGGIISCGCTYVWNDLKKMASCANDGTKLECPTLTDSGYDFGNSVFNDHHFHYGYFIYSAAVVAKYNPKWVKQYNQKVLALIRDIANPSSQDPFFSAFRHFDWYVGHSWALGIVADANGRNQESSSEAVNAWYGMYLYGLATNNLHLKTLGNALLSMEAHSTNYYWHVKASNAIYPPEYEHNIVGIVHEMLVEFQTFFGLRGFFVHGIQLIPITPMVNLMFQPDWVATAYPNFKQYCMGDQECKDSGFITFLYTEQALLDREGAWTNALSLPDFVFSDECPGGNGNSRTALLHFIATYGKPPAGSVEERAEFTDVPAAEAKSSSPNDDDHRGTILLAVTLVSSIVVLLVLVQRLVANAFGKEEQYNLLPQTTPTSAADLPMSDFNSQLRPVHYGTGQ